MGMTERRPKQHKTSRP